MRNERFQTEVIGGRVQSPSYLEFFKAIGYTVGREIQLTIGKNEIVRAWLNDNSLLASRCKCRGELPEGGRDWQPHTLPCETVFTGKRDGGGVFFRPNRIEGGINDANFKGSDLLFYEIDDQTLEQQHESLERFTKITGLLPVAVVFSGGKSIHVYFRLAQELNATDWKRLQRKLCVVQLSDASLANLNRLMRLPGGWRLKNGEWTEQKLLSTNADAVYSVAEFEAALDATGLFPYGISDDRFRGWKRDKSHTSNFLLEPDSVLHPPIPKIEPRPFIDFATVSDFPLELALSRNNKSLLDSGAGDGGRNNAAYELACDLIGSANLLRSLGVRFVGDPEALFNSFCQKCSPVLDKQVAQDMWCRVSRRNLAKGTRPAESIEKTISWYQRQTGLQLCSFPSVAGCKPPSGFGNIGKQQRKSDRDFLIQKRLDKFREFWNGGLKRDFSITDHTPFEFDNVIEYEGYCPTIDLKNLYADAILIRGWLGAGKTEAVLDSVSESFPDDSIVWVAPLRNLLKQTGTRAEQKGFDFYFYQDDARTHRWQLESGVQGVYGFCPEGFKTYAVGRIDWSDKILAIDEFQQIRKACTNLKEQGEFFRAIRECKLLIVADAFLGDADAALIQSLRDGGMTLYEQKAAKSPKKINWIEAIKDDGDISFKHDSIILQLVFELCSTTKGRIGISCDDRNLAHAIRQFIQENFSEKRVHLCSSVTVQANALLMTDPTPFLKDFDVFIYTPTIKSGADIQTPFERGLAIFRGIVKPCEMLQMIGRLRQCPDWMICAPRRTGSEHELTPSLDGAKIRQWGEQIGTDLKALGANAPEHLQSWHVWEDLTKYVEKSFASEYLRSLVEEYFETVEVRKVKPESESPATIRVWGKVSEDKTYLGQLQKLRKWVKYCEAKEILTADLKRGQELVTAKNAPSTDKDVWAIELAKLFADHPEPTKTMIKEVKVETLKDEAIEFCITLTSPKIQKIKNWVQLQQANGQDDLDLTEYLRQNPTGAASKGVKRRLNLAFMRRLNLQRLAMLRKDETGAVVEKKVAHKTHFNPDSPEIKQLWVKFQNCSELKKLCPTVTTVKQLWEMIKQALRFFGYESNDWKNRVKTPGRLHPNGKDRNGKQRFTESKAVHFLGWFLIRFSGNEFFREHFDEIVDSITQLIDRERTERRKWREQNAPPDQMVA